MVDSVWSQDQTRALGSRKCGRNRCEVLREIDCSHTFLGRGSNCFGESPERLSDGSVARLDRSADRHRRGSSRRLRRMDDGGRPVLRQHPQILHRSLGVAPPAGIGCLKSLTTRTRDSPLRLLGAYAIGFIIVAVRYAVTITAIANEWLYHRLVCISGNQCAVGTVNMPPNRDTLLGAFDNVQFFDIRLMPHR
jgi:hypothetical protein